jgi:hypothetical protein
LIGATDALRRGERRARAPARPRPERATSPRRRAAYSRLHVSAGPRDQSSPPERLPTPLFPIGPLHPSPIAVAGAGGAHMKSRQVIRAPEHAGEIVFAAKASGEAYGRLARAHGYVDGFMRADRAGIVTKGGAARRRETPRHRRRSVGLRCVPWLTWRRERPLATAHAPCGYSLQRETDHV